MSDLKISKVITGKLQEMGADEIRKHIDDEEYYNIKDVDDNPQFKAFVIGHEGTSSGKMLGIGKVVKKWIRSTIQMLSDKLRIGTKVFGFHQANSNDNTGRVTIGEIVGKFLQTIQDKLSLVGIVYVKPEHRGQNFDIASVEADITLDSESREVKSVGPISGIALGNSTMHTPGFSGATLQGVLQEMAEEIDLTDPEQNPLIPEIEEPEPENENKPDLSDPKFNELIPSDD